jgi:hypothetical protein
MIRDTLNICRKLQVVHSWSVHAAWIQVVNEPDERGQYPYSRAFVIYPEGITNSQNGLFRYLEGIKHIDAPVKQKQP